MRAGSARGPLKTHKPWFDWALLTAVAVTLSAGAVLWLTGSTDAANLCWAVTTVAALLPAIFWVVRSLRHREVGVDVIAVLALAGTLVVGEYLAGAVIALMLATGRSLEAYAGRRATRDLRALLERAPRSARRRTGPGGLETVPLDTVQPGDVLLVGPGEVVPVDGRLDEPALLDESTVTGESQPVQRQPADTVASGVLNTGPGFGMRATATAARSTYAGIVRMAQDATARKAPMVRIADRYAAAFLPFTIALAGLSWILSDDLTRAVAVLVVATPCPLILATPIAIVSGLSRAARRGVVIRDGAALETLGRARTLLIDKTGTLTLGRPQAAETITAPGVDPHELLRLAASVEQLSPHVLAAAIVHEATTRSLTLSTPTDVTEEPGTGVTGRVDRHLVQVGQRGDGDLPPWAQHLQQRAEHDCAAIVWVRLDAHLAGALMFHDPIRSDAPRTIQRLRATGFTRIVMLTGDRPQPAADVARAVGVQDVVDRCTPQTKVDRVQTESAQAVTVMVGDGVNDAPALAAAHVGVALGATGATASANVADAVLTVDQLDRLADAVDIARRSRRIATQSAATGMSLALAAMAAAAAGLLPPVAGAFLQEGIDIVVILNALRALTPGTTGQVPADHPAATGPTA